MPVKMESSTSMSKINLGLLDITADRFNSIYYIQSNTTEKVIPNAEDVVDEEIARLLQVFIRPVLVILGTYGNAVSFYIMRRGSLKKVSTCFYMAMLAIADTLFLWSGCFAAWLRTLTHFRTNPFTWLDCKFLNFFSFFSSGWSSSILAVMCLEKFFALYFPLKTRSICTVAMAKRVTFVVTLLLVAINMRHFFIFKAITLPNGAKDCIFVNVVDIYPLIHYKIQSTIYSFIPFTIMVLTNGAIIFKFMRALCARDQGGTQATNQALSKSANRGTAMLITVSLAFLILTGPVAVSYIITINPDRIQKAVTVLVRYINHSINAVLYCMSGSRFRKELTNTYPFRLCRKNAINLRGGSQNDSSSAGKSTTMTVMPRESDNESKPNEEKSGM